MTYSLSELAVLTQTHSDCFGECDECHDEAQLWSDPESEGCGDFDYCKTCWEQRIAELSRKEREG